MVSEFRGGTALKLALNHAQLQIKKRGQRGGEKGDIKIERESGDGVWNTDGRKNELNRLIDI